MATTYPQPRSTLARTIDAPLRQTPVWSVDEAYRYCERLARSHYENFPVGSIIVPRALRPHFYAIYAFARIADDFADEQYEEHQADTIAAQNERLALLEEWRVMLTEAFAGRARHPVFVALAKTQAKFSLPVSLFEDLLSAFRQDVTKRRYASYADLLDYCRRSANPVGRLLLLLFGHREEAQHRLADDICTGLQLANHWQDVAVDLGKDRVYLPEAEQRRFGVNLDTDGRDLRQQSAAPQVREAFFRLLAFEVERAREHFRRGKPLCLALPGRLGLELRLVWLGGVSILDAIVGNDYDVFARRPVITKGEKARLLWTAVRKGAFTRI